MQNVGKSRTKAIAIVGGAILAIILVVGTIGMGVIARRDTDRAVRTVSRMYLDELAGRREQVVENNLHSKIDVIRIAVDQLSEENLSDKSHLEAYQRRMKQLYSLDKFAFVDTEGLIYTSTGTQDNIGDYAFDYRTISQPEISVLNPESGQRQVIIAVPVSVPFQGKTFCVCFMAIDMSEMLAGLSMDVQDSGATFSNLYTGGGIALTDQVLGGQAPGTNLLEAISQAEFDEGFSYDQIVEDFAQGNRGVVSFTYDNIPETLSYVPVAGTDGLEATRTIRALDRADAKTVPIIALTANAFDEDVQRSLQAGLNAHLSKPVQPDALYETLEGLIRS